MGRDSDARAPYTDSYINCIYLHQSSATAYMAELYLFFGFKLLYKQIKVKLSYFPTLRQFSHSKLLIGLGSVILATVKLVFLYLNYVTKIKQHQRLSF